jgi:hypothetical protein
MPFSGSTFTGPTGSTNAAAGQVIQSAVWDAINTDYANALTLLMTQFTTHNPNFENILAPNGGLNIWQRGLTNSVGASTTQYTADRWYLTTGANQACTVAAVPDIDTGGSINHAAKITRTVGQTGITPLTFGYPLDTDEVGRLRGRVVSFSCTVKSGANWSPASGTLSVTFAVGTGAASKRSGFTGDQAIFSVNTNLTVSSATTVISGTSTITIPTTSNQGEFQFVWTPTGAAGADDSIIVDDVVLNTGTIIENWTEIPFETCLLMCNRHYRKTFPYTTAPATGVGYPGALAVMSAAATQFGMYWQFGPAVMRVTASFTTYNPTAASANWQNISTGSSLAVTVDTANGASPTGIFIYGVSATNASNLIYIHAVADSSI